MKSRHGPVSFSVIGVSVAKSFAGLACSPLAGAASAVAHAKDANAARNSARSVATIVAFRCTGLACMPAAPWIIGYKPFVVRYRTTNGAVERSPFTLRYFRPNGFQLLLSNKPLPTIPADMTRP